MRDCAYLSLNPFKTFQTCYGEVARRSNRLNPILTPRSPSTPNPTIYSLTSPHPAPALQAFKQPSSSSTPATTSPSSQSTSPATSTSTTHPPGSSPYSPHPKFPANRGVHNSSTDHARRAGAHWRTHAAPHETELCAWDVETYEYWRRIVEREERGGEGLEKSGLKVRKARLGRADPNHPSHT